MNHIVFHFLHSYIEYVDKIYNPAVLNTWFCAQCWTGGRELLENAH